MQTRSPISRGNSPMHVVLPGTPMSRNSISNSRSRSRSKSIQSKKVKKNIYKEEYLDNNKENNIEQMNHQYKPKTCNQNLLQPV